MKIDKLYTKKVVDSSAVLANAVVLGLAILKRSDNATLELDGETLSDSVAGNMMLTDINNELSTRGNK